MTSQGTNVKESLDITTEARDRSTCRQEREDVVRAVRTTVQVPGVSGKADAGCNGNRLSTRVVRGGDGTGVDIGEPDHDLVHVGATGRVGREQVVGDVSND